jgi:hypothetical protein
MSFVSQFLGLKRWPIMAALALAAVAAALLLGSSGRASAELLENKCTSGEFCAWAGANYNGAERFLSCPGSFPLPNAESFSAKNRCNVSVEIGWAEGGSTNWKACMKPGGERPEPGRFNTRREALLGCP